MIATENTENTEYFPSVPSVPSVVYYSSFIGICILLVNIVWFLTIIDQKSKH